MQVHVNKGFLGRRHTTDGLESGFSPISPGDYFANFNPDDGLCIVKPAGEDAYLKLCQFEEKVAMGDLVVLTI